MKASSQPPAAGRAAVPGRHRILPFEHNARSIERLGRRELEKVYHDTRAWQDLGQDEEVRRLFDAGLVEL